MQPEALEYIEIVRSILDAPITLTSAYRCDEYAEMVGIGIGDAHNTGWAFDIKTVNGRHRSDLMNAAREAQCTRMGVGEGFMHFDWQPEPAPQNVVWDYFKR
jgi:uncharacterized protein YcbK (DUF882 family)